MRRSLAPAIVALSLALAGCASTKSAPVASAPPTAPPRLIVAIAVDQFSADLFAEYRNHFTAGLARLQQGAVFPSGYQSHAATETCPGHSTLLTGAHPSRTGIIANNWFDPGLTRADKKVYCAEDERDPASTSGNPVVSAVHLKVPTLGERMKAVWPTSRNVAVSAKDRAVIMMGGHFIDEAYWWKNGAFVTLAGQALAPAVTIENTVLTMRIKRGEAGYAVPAWCAAREREVKAGPASVGTGHFAMEPGKEPQFRVSPRMDAATADLAIGLTDAMNLGRSAAPDILSVSFSATDYVGHATGTEGVEMCIQLAELDRSIGRLLDHLDLRGIDYAVMLSADHGGLDLPERLAAQAVPQATRADRALLAGALAKAVSQQTGIATPDPLIYADGPFGDYYLSHRLSSVQKAQVLAALVPMLKAHPQVAAVFTATELAEAPLPVGSPQDWSLKDRARASFDPVRSGDLVVLLDRAVVPITDPSPGYVATHGSAWDYDRRVPILFWRKGVPGLEQPAPVETVDIAPTLIAMLGLPVPEGAYDGRCLDIDGSAANSCEGPK